MFRNQMPEDPSQHRAGNPDNIGRMVDHQRPIKIRITGNKSGIIHGKTFIGHPVCKK